MYQTDGTKQGVESKKLKVMQLVKKSPTLPVIYISLLQFTVFHESVMTSVYTTSYTSVAISTQSRLQSRSFLYNG